MGEGEGGLLPYINNIGMCGPKGYGFWCCFGLKTGIHFAHFGLESGWYSFRGNHGDECMCLLFQFQMIRKEREMCKFEIFCLHSNLRNDDMIYAYRPVLKTGMDYRGQAPVVQKVESIIHWIHLYPGDTGVENDIFWPEMGPGFQGKKLFFTSLVHRTSTLQVLVVQT